MLKIDKDSIRNFFLKNQNKDVHYHTWEHCESVAKRALMLANMLGVSDEQDLLALELASYFHDIGYDIYKTEEENISKASSLFLAYCTRVMKYDSKDIPPVAFSLIEATKYPHGVPSNMLEQIIQDADLTQCWDWDALTITKLLRAEGKEVVFDLEFPSLDLLNTGSAKQLHISHLAKYKGKLAKELQNRALEDVLTAYRQGYNQQIVLQSLQSLEMVVNIVSSWGTGEAKK